MAVASATVNRAREPARGRGVREAMRGEKTPAIPEDDPSEGDPAAAWLAARRRRRVLIGAGVGLLALGAIVNADRLGLRRAPVSEPISDEELLVEQRLVAYMHQPAQETKAESRHMGEEGVMGRPMTRNKSGLYAVKGPSGPMIAAPEPMQFEPRAGTETTDDARSTFSVDVDTASYSLVRRILRREGRLPHPDEVRTEELVNYFDYDDPAPQGDVPFSVTTDVAACPWAPDRRLVRVALRGAVGAVAPARNLVFLVDVSGSMDSPDKLPLVQNALAELTERLDDRDRIAIVVYAGAAGLVLPPTSGTDKDRILAALRSLESGGGTNGGEGIELAYRLAREHWIEGGVNRVVLATDGDFNVGISSFPDLMALIERERESGVFLSVLGVGDGNLQDHTMEQLADRGNGNYAYIDGISEARKVLVREAASTLETIAKDVKVQVEFDPTRVARHRLVGYENRALAHRDFANDAVDAGDIGAGHTVTALYEIEPVAFADDGPIAQVRLRYKAPDGDTSELVTTSIVDDEGTLADASADLRFAAAVATFAQLLRRTTAIGATSHADVFALASEAIGDDPHCERREFLSLVHTAGTLAGETMPPAPAACRPAAGPATPRTVAAPSWAAWRTFALEVLRLLPPLLALPLFVMAFVSRRTKRSS